MTTGQQFITSLLVLAALAIPYLETMAMDQLHVRTGGLLLYLLLQGVTGGKLAIVILGVAYAAVVAITARFYFIRRRAFAFASAAAVLCVYTAATLIIQRIPLG